MLVDEIFMGDTFDCNSYGLAKADWFVTYAEACDIAILVIVSCLVKSKYPRSRMTVLPGADAYIA